MEVRKLSTNVSVRKGIKIGNTELLCIMGIRVKLLMDAGHGTQAETNLIESIDAIWEEIKAVYKERKR